MTDIFVQKYLQVGVKSLGEHATLQNQAFFDDLHNPLCVKKGGVRKMLRSVKTFTYIWSIWLSYDMCNLEGHHFPYFMAILLPFYGFFWPKMAILGHR